MLKSVQKYVSGFFFWSIHTKKKKKFNGNCADKNIVNEGLYYYCNTFINTVKGI